MTKSALYDLINKSDLFVVFEELHNYFLGNNDSLNKLQTEYIDRPDNFNAASFNNRLKSFISLHYKENIKPNAIDQAHSSESSDYELLCELDFKLQYLHFQLYKYKKIAAFLLHGETDAQGNDLKWLCNQILHKEKLIGDRHIIIDFNSNIPGSFDRILQEFYLTFSIDTTGNEKTKPIVRLRAELEDRLKCGPLVCIINSPDNIFSSQTELCRLYDEFLDYMNENINQKGHNNSLIFLFVSNRPADAKCYSGKYFLWFIDDGKTHIKNALECPELRIIDIAPLQKIKESDITDWITWSFGRADLFKRTSALSGREKDILETGNTPFQVIKKICHELDIKIQDKWIT